MFPLPRPVLATHSGLVFRLPPDPLVAFNCHTKNMIVIIRSFLCLIWKTWHYPQLIGKHPSDIIWQTFAIFHTLLSTVIVNR